MAKKNTIAALRIKQEMKEKSLTAAELASISGLSLYAVENILAGKSSKLDKLESIAKALGKPLMYLVDINYGNENIKNDNTVYDGELHYKVVKSINEVCQKNKIYLTKNKMDELFDLVYPRVKKADPDDLILIQTEAIINYAIKNNKIV